MPTYQYEAMDAHRPGDQGRRRGHQPGRSAGHDPADGLLRHEDHRQEEPQDGGRGKEGRRKGKSFALGGVKQKLLTTFTRQLSILQDAGLPILRSLKILEQQAKPGALKNALIDVCEEIEGGATLSEAMAKSPKAFDRLYVNMIKAGEAGGALEVILKRLAEFQERSEVPQPQGQGRLGLPDRRSSSSPCGILVFIMFNIVPQFVKIFKDFGTDAARR